MSKIKYHKTETGFEGEYLKDGVNYDVKVSMDELFKLFDIVRIKFENHLELAKMENKLNSSLTGIHQSFMKTFKSIERLNV